MSNHISVRKCPACGHDGTALFKGINNTTNFKCNNQSCQFEGNAPLIEEILKTAKKKKGKRARVITRRSAPGDYF